MCLGLNRLQASAKAWNLAGMFCKYVPKKPKYNMKWMPMSPVTKLGLPLIGTKTFKH